MNSLPTDQPLSAEVIDWVHETANEMLREDTAPLLWWAEWLKEVQ